MVDQKEHEIAQREELKARLTEEIAHENREHDQALQRMREMQEKKRVHFFFSLFFSFFFLLSFLSHKFSTRKLNMKENGLEKKKGRSLTSYRPSLMLKEGKVPVCLEVIANISIEL